MDKSLLANLIISFALFTIALLFKLFQPKSRNAVYGYRTSTSLRSDEAWRKANKFSARILLILSIILIPLSVSFYLIFPYKNTSIILTSLFVLIMPLLILILTENHLKKFL